MRSDAKASTAGSKQRNGTGRRKPALLLLAVAACVAALAVVVGSASGSTTRFLQETFGSSAQPSFPADRGMAFDQGSEELYVIDSTNDTLSRFNADGSASDFGALGSNVIDGEGTGDETPLGHLAFESNRQREQVAIDESGEATDGNVYVTQAAKDVVDIFNGEGEYLGALSESTGTGAFGEPCGVAVDDEGTVYVGDRGDDRIHVFDPAGAVPVNADNTVSYSTVTDPCTLAAGTGATEGFLFVNASTGTQLRKVDAATGEVKYEIATGASTAAVDPATGHVFAARNTGTNSSVDEYDASGAAEASLVSSFKPGSTVEGVALNSAEEQVYISRSSTENVEVFGAPLIVPDVVTEAPSANTGARATLAGTVNPDGVELDECSFEWGENKFAAEYTEVVPCAETPAEIGAGTSPVAVHADLSGLRPHGVDTSTESHGGTTVRDPQLNPGGDYRYRLVAVNPNATIEGSNQNFSTPKTVFTEAPSGATGTEVTLNGSVNPDGETISGCVFEWGPPKELDEARQRYPETAPCVPGPGGITGTSPVAVGADLSGLDPGTSYVYRLKVTYPTGDIFGLPENAQTAGPRVLGAWSENVGLSEATLKSAIDPEGKATTYRFEYGTTEAYGSETEELAVGSDSSVHTVARSLAGLEEGTVYHYRLIATNADAENVGPDKTFATLETFVPDTSCPNQVFRYGPGANLPDCRGYEMVSPVDKNGGDIVNLGEGLPFWKESRIPGTMAAFLQAASQGNRIAYTSGTGFADQVSGQWANQYIATRGPEGWTTHGIDPPKAGNLLGAFILGPEASNNWWGFTDDLSQGYLWDFADPPLTEDANAEFPNFYRRDLSGGAGGAYEALTNVPSFGGAPQVPGGPIGSAFQFYLENDLADFSKDGSVVFFSARQAYTADANLATNSQVYASSEGQLHLVSVMPDGSAATGESLMNGDQNAGGNWASDDGRRAYFRSGTGTPRIYLRTNPLEEQSALSGGECTEPDKACTVQVSSGAAAVRAISADGAKIWYDEGVSGRHKLYEYDAEAGSSTLVSEDLPTGETGTLSVLGASDDLSRVYFVSREALAPGGVEGEPNVYLREGGAETFVARLWQKDVAEGPRIGGTSPFFNQVFDLSSPTTAVKHSARVSPDGRFATFMSLRSLTDYDSTDALSGEPDAQVYQYDAESGELLCASCNPSGERPVGKEAEQPYGLAVESASTDIWVAGWLPGPEHFLGHTRVLMDDGTVFFNSFDDLVARDTNGAMDVYQWKPDGVRGCERPKGCVELLSTGQSREPSRFAEANADGSEVYFTTSSSIAPQDPGSVDLYVAREGGGYPPPPSPPDCAGDACQAVPPAPRIATPASAAFEGAGDPTPRRNCGAAARRAAKQSRRAKRLRRAAKRSSSERRSKALRRRSARFARNAKRLSTNAKRCRRANRRASR